MPSRVPITIEIENIAELIHQVRGKKVMLDRDLASLYEVETRALKQAVRRNIDRFPADFMFETLDQLISVDSAPRKKIGFTAKERQTQYRRQRSKLLDS